MAPRSTDGKPAKVETFSDPLPGDIDRLATDLMTAICEREQMLGVAESCTGGLLAAVLTDVEGCSHGFDRGFVTYTDDAKHEVLGVPRAILKTDGAVSAPSAKAMAEGALAASKAHVVLSITGYAGPGGPGEEPGLVFFGLTRRGGETEVVERHFGDLSRAEVRRLCLRTSIEMLKTAVDG